MKNKYINLNKNEILPKLSHNVSTVPYPGAISEMVAGRSRFDRFIYICMAVCSPTAICSPVWRFVCRQHERAVWDAVPLSEGETALSSNSFTLWQWKGPGIWKAFNGNIHYLIQDREDRSN